MVESFLFRAGDYASEDEAFQAYRHLYSIGADVVRGDGAFFAQVRAWRFNKLILFERRLSGVGHARTHRVQSDGFDHFTLTYLAEGQLTGMADSRAFTLAPGEAVLLDMRRKMNTQAQQARIITVSLLRNVVEAAAGSPTRLHGRILDQRAAGLIGDYLSSLVNRSDALQEGAHAAVVRVLIDLLSIGLEAPPNHGESERRLLATIGAAEAFIVEHITRSDLTPDEVARAIGLSRASLYRLFAHRGGVARYIALKRLTLIRRRLEAGDMTSINQMAKDAGFRNEAMARRGFHELDRVDPDAYRAFADPSADAAVDRARLRWAAWMSEL